MPRKGENIYKRKDGRWEGRYIKKRDNWGKAIYGYVYAKSYNNVRFKLNEVKANIEMHISQKSSSLFSDWSEKWLEHKCLSVKQSTYMRYKNSLDSHIKPKLGSYKIHLIDANLLQQFFIEEFRDAVVEDYVYASLYYRAILNEQLKFAADYNKLKGEIAKKVKDSEREDENLQSFVNAMCTGIIKMENKFTFKYSREDDGFVDWYELTGVDTKPFGDSLPLYSAYIEFCKFDQDYIDEFNKVSRNRQLNDEDTCLECTKLIKDYLLKRADVMKEIADDQFRSKRRDIYKFVEALIRLIKSFERKLL